MKLKSLFAYVVVCAASTLLLAASASAQWSSNTNVSNAIEGSGFPAGVSAARCGNGIVVGFGDTETATGPGNDAGFAVSKDGGVTFSDRGVLADPALRFGGGDSPVIGCANASTFYYATVGFINDAAACFVGCSEIAISPSTDGGVTWQPTMVASQSTLDIYEFQSPSLAIDPTNPRRMYAAYINHNSTSPNDYPGCSNGDEYILEVVASSDGGKTWDGRQNPAGTGSPLIQPDHTCTGPGFDAEHTGMLVSPTVLVSPGGKVYVAYEFVAIGINMPNPPNEIRFTRSFEGGITFNTPITVSKVANNNALPQLGVDRTTKSSRGTIYLTWSGSPTGTYTDVLFADSVNFGLSFSFPRPISPAPAAGTGRFQSNPVITVDNDGQLEDCFYATPTNSPTSSSVYSYNCAASFNRGASWTVQRLTTSAPAGFDAVTSDFLLHNDGFFTAFELQANGQKRVVGKKSDNP